MQFTVHEAMFEYAPVAIEELGFDGSARFAKGYGSWMIGLAGEVPP
jgi:hypothetical protein